MAKDYRRGLSCFICTTLSLLLLILVSCDSSPGSSEPAVTPVVYAAGYCADDSNVNIPGYWRDGTWRSLPTLASNEKSNAYDIALSGDKIVICGYSNNSNSQTIPGLWIDEEWSELEHPSNIAAAVPWCLASFDDHMYCGGQYNGKAGYWLDGSWNTLDTSSEYTWSVAEAISVNASGVIAVGEGKNTSLSVVKGVSWINGTQSELASLVSTKRTGAFSLYGSCEDWYAGGYCVDENGAFQPGYWHNGEWTSLPRLTANATDADYTTFKAGVTVITISGGDVYAAGYCADDTGVLNPGYWKNGTWISLPRLSDNQKGGVGSFNIVGTDIYAGGYCINDAGLPIPGYWKNSEWTSLPMLSSTASNGGSVSSLLIQ